MPKANVVGTSKAGRSSFEIVLVIARRIADNLICHTVGILGSPPKGLALVFDWTRFDIFPLEQSVQPEGIV